MVGLCFEGDWLCFEGRKGKTGELVEIRVRFEREQVREGH